jgi:hypothetical protein
MTRIATTTFALLLLACRFDGGGLGAASDDDLADDDSLAPDGGAAPDAAISPDAERGDPPDAPPQPVAGMLIAEDAVGAVTLDGSDQEFAAAGAVAVQWPIQSSAIYQTESSSYSASAVVRVAAIHDAQRIYFFAEVQDTAQQFDSAEVWNDDGVAFYLDVEGDASGPFDVDDHEIVVRGDGAWNDFGPVGTSATVSVATASATGVYRLEVAIDKASLGAAVGTTMGFDLLVTDDDGWTNSDYDALGVWYTSARPECTTCCVQETENMPWCDTTLYGSLRLD